MTVLVLLRHATRYRYDRPVRLGPHEIRLKPIAAGRTPVKSYALALRPAGHTLHWHYDAAGNAVARALFPDRSEALDIEVELAAELAPFNPFDFVVDASADRLPFHYPVEARHDLAPYLAPAEDGERILDWVERFRSAVIPGSSRTVDLLVHANQQLCQDIAYVERLEHGVQSCEETLRRATGSCRDSSWLLVQVLRRLGIAARFVSGYLLQLASGRAGAPASDTAALHAWTEDYLPGAGWIGLDPTSGLLAAEGHIALARAAAPALAAPVTGSLEPCRSSMEAELSIQRLP